jgi:hypothetical protein
VNKAKYLSLLIDLDFKPKYDKCDGPEMNTNYEFPSQVAQNSERISFPKVFI